MHGVSGPRTNFNSLKCYVNHTTAREGQWRMPRNYAPQKVDIRIKNYNYCNHSSYNTGFQLPAWLQWAQFGVNLFQNLFGGLFPAKQEAPKETANPLQAQLDEMQKKIDELTKQNEELKNKKTEPNEPTTPTQPTDTNPKVDDKFDVSADAEEIKKTTKEEITTTTEAVVKKGRTRADGKVEYQGWKTLTASYGVPNTKEFRNWFRQEYLNGKDVWEIGTQNFPTKIEYPKGSGKIYQFNGETFAKPIDLHDNSGKGGVTTANMDKKTKTNETTQTTYKGSAKATWTDKNGETHTVTYTTPETNYSKANDAKQVALSAIKAKVPEEYRSNAKFQVGAREN